MSQLYVIYTGRFWCNTRVGKILVFYFKQIRKQEKKIAKELIARKKNNVTVNQKLYFLFGIFSLTLQN